MTDDDRQKRSRSSSRRKGGRGDRRRDDRRGQDRRRSGGRRGDRRGGDRRGGDRRGGDRRGGGRRDDRRSGRRDDRRGGDRRDDGRRILADDKVDLVPSYGSQRRAKGPDGRPAPREIVVPGQALGGTEARPGLGAYEAGSEIVAATLGIKNVHRGYASVIPLSGQYIPRVGDVVIGRVADVGPSTWLIDIHSPYPAPMHVNEVPFHVEFGETTDYLKAGDSVIVRITKVTEVGRVQVSMEGPGLRKLQGGQLVDIPHSKVPRVIGTKGSMISLIKKYTGCRLVVGQNGRIWMDGDPEDILIAMGAIKMISEHAHVHGLTNTVKEYLQKAKGIDPEAEEKEAEAAMAEEPKDKRDRSGKRKDGRKPRPKKGEKEKEGEADDEDVDLADDELCSDPEAEGDGIVTVLAPDGESLMVVDDEDLPECEPKGKRSSSRKEDG